MNTEPPTPTTSQTVWPGTVPADERERLLEAVKCIRAARTTVEDESRPMEWDERDDVSHDLGRAIDLLKGMDAQDATAAPQPAPSPDRRAADLVDVIFGGHSEVNDRSARALIELVFALAHEQDDQLRDALALAVVGPVYRLTAAYATGEDAFLSAAIPQPETD